jgi:hypothetical protein
MKLLSVLVLVLTLISGCAFMEKFAYHEPDLSWVDNLSTEDRAKLCRYLETMMVVNELQYQSMVMSPPFRAWGR